jgi:glycyl-tRNA synthetase
MIVVNSYLRPETAQGHFLNFLRLLEFSNNRLPFASAQIGRSFRNEISPRAGLLRVREFTMAEIEHFVDPKDKSHPRFEEVKDVKLHFLDRATQSRGKTDLFEMTVGEAVDRQIVANQTLGYFVARIHDFLLKIGIDSQRLRFRQHMSNEMAHYATDCWDAEIYMQSYGWIECVGCADRAAFDLTVHSKKTGAPLVVRQALKEPLVTQQEVPEFDKKLIGKTFGKETGNVTKIVNEMSQGELAGLKKELTRGYVCSCQALRTAFDPYTCSFAILTKSDGSTISVPSSVLKVESKTIKQHSMFHPQSSDEFLILIYIQLAREFTPNVIEPSFGLGRILYAVLEHSYWCRESDIDRGVRRFPTHLGSGKLTVWTRFSHSRL